MIRKSLIISLLLITTSSGFSQVISKNSEKIYLIKVKQFNEFIDRFNYKTDFYSNPVDSIFKSKVSREAYIDLLFNSEDPRLNKSNINYSPNYSEIKQEFINQVGSNNYAINKYSPEIIAEVKLKISYLDNIKEISLLLNQEIVEKDMVKWVIVSVKGDIFNTLKTDTTLLRFISPSSNETSFMNLKRALEDKNHLQYYTRKDFNYDPLSAFIFCVGSDIIKVNDIIGITYHILDIPGWCITVKEFNRNSMNSGWLIDDINKNDLKYREYILSQ